MSEPYSRHAWRLLEPLNAVTYFAPECRSASRDVGLRGFWMGYFASRAAPLGEVGPAVVAATFFVFHPERVARALPDAWTFASVSAVLASRAVSAAAALRRLTQGAGAAAEQALPLLGRVVEAAEPSGRPLFAANRAVTAPGDPVAALWHAATTLREHRGDGHVACLTAEGLTGCEALVLFAAEGRSPAELLRESRGWSAEEWEAATRSLAARGLVEGSGLSDGGRRLRRFVEARTDALADEPFAALTDRERDGLLDLLRPLARIVSESETIPFPNPMGLPRQTGTLPEHGQA